MPDSPIKPGTEIYRWLLEKRTDTNGNAIEYHYTGFEGSDNQKYLKEIRYGPGAGPWDTFYFVHLTYEERPDWTTDYRSGFLVKTSRRLMQIDIGVQGVAPSQCAVGDWNQDGTPDALIRRYALSYDDTNSHPLSLVQGHPVWIGRHHVSATHLFFLLDFQTRTLHVCIPGDHRFKQ